MNRSDATYVASLAVLVMMFTVMYARKPTPAALRRRLPVPALTLDEECRDAVLVIAQGFATCPHDDHRMRHNFELDALVIECACPGPWRN